jgi:hypothetical protein
VIVGPVRAGVAERQTSGDQREEQRDGERAKSFHSEWAANSPIATASHVGFAPDITIYLLDHPKSCLNGGIRSGSANSSLASTEREPMPVEPESRFRALRAGVSLTPTDLLEV